MTRNKQRTVLRPSRPRSLLPPLENYFSIQSGFLRRHHHMKPMVSDRTFLTTMNTGVGSKLLSVDWSSVDTVKGCNQSNVSKIHKKLAQHQITQLKGIQFKLILLDVLLQTMSHASLQTAAHEKLFSWTEIADSYHGFEACFTMLCHPFPTLYSQMQQLPSYL